MTRSKPLGQNYYCYKFIMFLSQFVRARGLEEAVWWVTAQTYANKTVGTLNRLNSEPPNDAFQSAVALPVFYCCCCPTRCACVLRIDNDAKHFS